MQVQEITIGSKREHRYESGGTGSRAHFAHANGFPFGAYQPFLRELGEGLEVFGLGQRGTWPSAGPPDPRLRWRDHADDLLEALKSEEGPVWGIGHSMGATITAYAAARRPSAFRGLVLVEPAMVSSGLARLLACTPRAVKRRVQPMRGALGRRDVFDSRREFVQWALGRRPFERLSREALEAFAAGGLVERGEGGVTLAFSREWEAHHYSCAPDGLAVLEAIRDVPTVGIRGAPSMFLTESLWRGWQRRCPHHTLLEMPEQRHLMPLEAPLECAAKVLEAVRRLETNI